MRVSAAVHRLLCCFVAAVVMVAAFGWATLAPAHARGPASVRAAAVMPCHPQLQDSNHAEDEDGCRALCAMLAADHFTGEVVMAVALDGGKLIVQPSARMANIHGHAATALAMMPVFRRSVGPGVYPATHRLRI